MAARTADSVRFDTYYKAQFYDPTSLVWKDVQRSYGTREEAEAAFRGDATWRVMEVTPEGRAPLDDSYSEQTGTGETPMTESSEATTRKPRSRVSLADLIEAGLIAPRQWLSTKAYGQTWKAQVTKDGQLKFHGETYPTPSALIKAIKTEAGAKRVSGGNGWVWLTTKDGELLDDLRRRAAGEFGSAERAPAE